MEDEVLELCEKIMDISANYNITYEEILEKVQEQLDYESFMAFMTERQTDKLEFQKGILMIMEAYVKVIRDGKKILEPIEDYLDNAAFRYGFNRYI